MKAKYNTPDTSGWRDKCDDLFLARYRGRPCEICGATHRVYNGRRTRSMGHHTLEKAMHRTHRYEPNNIVILCAEHHGQHSRVISPHGEDTAAVAAFYAWFIFNKPDQWEWFKSHARDEWDKSWTYKEKYVELGGTLLDTKFVKDQKPVNHASKVREIEEDSK